MLLKELYQEKGSTFTHDGKEYDLNKVLRSVDKQDPIKVAVKDLEWEIEDDLMADDDERVKKADLSAPILVTKWQDKIVTVDGYHRLIKAVRDGVKELPAKEVSKEQLEKALV
jgi:hypothetical protein